MVLDSARPAGVPRTRAQENGERCTAEPATGEDHDMNAAHGHDMTRPARRAARPGALAATLAAAALLAAACGGGPSGSSPGPASSPSPGLAHAAARFAACMRSHGIPDFPTPAVTGDNIAVRVPASLGISMNSPQLHSAEHACQPLLGGSSPS
jgi:hypothetical protein